MKTQTLEAQKSHDGMNALTLTHSRKESNGLMTKFIFGQITTKIFVFMLFIYL